MPAIITIVSILRRESRGLLECTVVRAAASIVAKVARDEAMLELDRRFPGYGLASNMGYASVEHREALRRLGPSEIHRRSFQGTQAWLF